MTVSNKLPRWLKTHPLELLDAPWLEDTFELSLLTDILLPLSLSEPSSDEDRSGEGDDVFGTWQINEDAVLHKSDNQKETVFSCYITLMQPRFHIDHYIYIVIYDYNKNKTLQ